MPQGAELPPRELRVFIYDHLLAQGLPPSSADIGLHFGVSADAARQALGSLGIGKTALLHPQTGEIWMAGPFASGPSAYRVVGPNAAWWANCAWDMLGVAVIAGEAVRVETACTDCGEPIELEVVPDRGVVTSAPEMVVHFLLPARRWYDDIGYT